jgi:phosphatidate cytidylyltransferase
MALRPRDMALRAASAAVLAPAAVLATWAGGYWFLGLVVLASILLAVEWAMMSAHGAWRAMASIISIVLIAAIVTTYLGRLPVGLGLLLAGVVLAGLAARLRGLQALNTAYGVLYLGWPVVLLIWLRDGHDPIGLHWTVFVFAVAWASDIMAYIVGSAVGGPKLWPRFSPNKTWSGFLGGLVAGMIAGGAMAAWLDLGQLTVFWGIGLGLAAALATMAGDLWESALKRRFGVKDAGNLIPGHGGLLDRVDGLMFAVVVVAAGRLLVLFLEGAI